MLDCEHMRPRVADFRCRILDNGLYILNFSGSCGFVMGSGETGSGETDSIQAIAQLAS